MLIVGRQLDGGGTEILLQLVELGGTWDRRDIRPLRQQPGERDLCRRRALLARNPPEQVDKGLLLLHGLWREARDRAAKIVLSQLGILAHGACEKAFAERGCRARSPVDVARICVAVCEGAEK